MRNLTLNKMNTKTVLFRSILHIRTSIVICCWVLAFFAVACSDKSNDPQPEIEEPEEPGTAVPYHTLQRVENFAVETDDENPTSARIAVLFSLENKMEVQLSLAKTQRWDLSFSGLYNSFLAGNNGQNSTNAGYGAAGEGGILVLEEAFDEVIDIPAANLFRTGGGVIGTDNAGDFGEGIGWYLYDFGGVTVGDGSYDKQHVAYALANPLKLADGTTLTPRTLVLRTAKGDYAKIRMISCYQDAFTPDTWFRTTPHMFFTFEYVLVPKGSITFEIKP